MIFEIDDIIPFSRCHEGETIRQILRYDSGYIKDLLIKNDQFVLSDKCMQEVRILTRGFFDNWKRPVGKTTNIFHSLKPYTSPYQYDFNNLELIELNNRKLKEELNQINS